MNHIKTLPNGDTEGFSVLITSMVPEQPEALRLVDRIEQMMAEGWATQSEADAAAELRRLHAENSQWRSVFGHLGTPDEIGNEWIALQDKQARDEALLRQALDTLEDIFGKNKVDVGVINALRERLGENT